LIEIKLEKLGGTKVMELVEAIWINDIGVSQKALIPCKDEITDGERN
jgi:hypothetical protein